MRNFRSNITLELNVTKRQSTIAIYCANLNLKKKKLYTQLQDMRLNNILTILAANYKMFIRNIIDIVNTIIAKYFVKIHFYDKILQLLYYVTQIIIIN